MNAIISRRTRSVARALVVLVTAGVIFLFPSVLYAGFACPEFLNNFGCRFCQNNHAAPV